MTAADRACDFLDRTSAVDPSRVVIMDLLDEISARNGEIERLRAELDRVWAAATEARNIVERHNKATQRGPQDG